MPFTPTSPITGTAQTGLTSPTYTLTADTAPDPSGKQFAVTALGGTQLNVSVNSPGAPFTITMFRPKVLKTLKIDSSGNRLPNGKNTYSIIVRKGVNTTQNVAAAGQVPDGLVIARLTIDVPAGTDLNDAANLRATMSALFGVLSQNSVNITDVLVTGIL